MKVEFVLLNKDMNKCFLFDVDGTLTPSRKEINNTFFSFLEDWSQRAIKNKDKVFLTTGSDLPKLKEQIPESFLNDISGYFCCMGNEYYSSKKNIYKNVNKDLAEKGSVHDWLLDKLAKNEYDKCFEPHFEFRTGMINFSFVGRGCSTEERAIYSKWDKRNKQREKLVLEFNKTFKEKKINAFVGGEISIDIQEEGADKSQCIKFLSKRLKNHDFIFFGDRCEKSGNDYSIYSLCKQSNRWHVNDWKHTFEILADNYF